MTDLTFRSRRVLVFMIAMWLPAAGAMAADFTGRWSGSFTDSDTGKTSPIYCILKEDGSTLTGSAGPSESHQMPITGGKIEGDHLTFAVRMAGGTITFDLTNDGGELKGPMHISDDGHTANARVVLKRIP
jgi:hypothetical protein